jgi:hypothetical protein
MKNDVINLADTIKIFKKNLKGFYLSLVTGIIIGLVGVFVNTNFINEKTTVNSTISIKNPLENYLVLDLFSLDTIQINEERVSITSTQEKIKNYYVMTKEYLKLVLSTIDFNKYDISEKKYGYKVEKQVSEKGFNIIIRNVSNTEKVQNNLNRMTDDFNNLIKPVILKNLLIETKFIENFLNISGNNPNSQKLSILVNIRKETLDNFRDQRLEIFDISKSESIQIISNKRIVMVSILLTLSLFLMFIILKK